MNAEEVWKSLVTESVVNPIELKTKRGINFKLMSNGEFYTLYKSKIEPSSKLKSPRPIYKDNLEKVFPYFERWMTGEKGISKSALKSFYTSFTHSR
ncbi:hypothetical protein [Rummeliibacillus suwonensis]|uniref:hypothetical protein n=1 Tax=Rummeliibacillus suwonensis TaxID=1306154 RepID=UPI0028A06DB2|nr:hypothetical protein [Rummeliibacillus suwonensis]